MPYKVKLFNGPKHREVVTVQELRPFDVAVESELISVGPPSSAMPYCRVARYGRPTRYDLDDADFCAFYESELCHG